MARRGPKGMSPAEQAASGERRPSRKVVPLFEGQASAAEPENVALPKWLKKVKGAAAIWAEKLALYRARGQKVTGFEAALAQYCALEADLIDLWSRKVEVPAAKLTQYRVFASEFYDTPASSKTPAGVKKPSNTFGRNGARPGA